MKQTIKFLAISMALASAAAYAGTKPAPLKFDVPYAPSKDVVVASYNTTTWQEIYKQPAAGVEEALRMLTLDKQTPATLGVALLDKLHLSVKSKPLVLAQTGTEYTRKKEPLEYDKECMAVPKKGDALLERFASEDGSTEVELKLQLVDYFAFGIPDPRLADPIRITAVTPENCGNVEESRLVYKGKMAVKVGGTLTQSVPVVVQIIRQ